MEEIKRSFGSFKNISEVCEVFGYEFEDDFFLKTKSFKEDDYFRTHLLKEFKNGRNFLNEYAICESIIRPIIAEVANENNLPFWSHENIEAKVDNIQLSGEPDYVFALPKIKNGTNMKTPIVCLGEAKKDKFIETWGQVGAEMVAAQELNKNKTVPILGLVTNGRNWEFGKLENKLFTIDGLPHSAGNLQEIFENLNWMFCEARKNADKIAETAKKEIEKNKN